MWYTERTPTRNHEVVGSILDLTQWGLTGCGQSSFRLDDASSSVKKREEEFPSWLSVNESD